MKSAHVFARHTQTDLPVVVSGDGPWLIDSKNKRYLDACGGAAVTCLGYSNTAVTNAVKEQIDKLAYAHTGFFTSDPAEKLAETLVSLAPEGIDRVYLVSGGSEATESAIKLAKQYFLEIGQTNKTQFIARKQSYHGNTLGALSAGGNEWRRAQFSQLLSPCMHHVDACHYWRFAQPGETEEQYGIRTAKSLEDKILQLGEENVAAFIAETVVGATMGAVPAVKGYFKMIREICDRYNVLLILDEVMCGIGRTGTLFASEQEGISPDIVCVAKGLGAGVQPLGAMLCSSTIYDAIATGTGFFQHGHTYLGHSAACAAGVAVLREIEQINLLDNVKQMGGKLEIALKKSFSSHPNIGDIRGRGLFWGLELVSDKTSKSPLPASLKIAPKIKAAAMHEGLMCYPGTGTIDGVSGDHILLAPSFIINESHIEEIIKRLSTAIDKALNV